MRIGHYAFNPTSPGGIASYIRRLTAGQRQRGDEIVLLSRDETTVDNGLDAVTVGPDVQTLFQTAAELDLDLLHLHHPVSAVPADRIPTVRTMHDNSGFCPSGSTHLTRTQQPCDRVYNRMGCLWGHLVDHCGSRRPQNLLENFVTIEQEQDLLATIPTMTVSEYMRNAIIRAGGSANQLFAVPSPAPTPSGPYSPPPLDDVPRFVYAGRLEPKKGVDWFLRALARCPSVRADIAGTGAEQYVQFLRKRAVQLGVDDRTTFHGWLSEPELNALYRKARAVVFPSLYHEPAGLVTLEAAAIGRPVIASRVGGIPEYADPAFSLLCDAGDVATMATHIKTLAEDWTRASSMGQAGIEVMKTHHQFASFLENVDRVYQKALPSQTSKDTKTAEQTATPAP